MRSKETGILKQRTSNFQDDSLICGWRFQYGMGLCRLEKEWKIVSTFLRPKMECFLSHKSPGDAYCYVYVEQENNAKPPLDAVKEKEDFISWIPSLKRDTINLFYMGKTDLNNK